MNSKTLDVQEILDKITDGFFMLDPQWRVICMNSEAEKILNRSKEELLGKDYREEFSDAIYEPLYRQFYLAMENLESVKFETYCPLLKQWFDVRAYPSVEGLSVYFLDITDEKQNSIRKDQYYQSLFTNNPDAVYSFDLRTKNITVNKALEKLTGYVEEELLNMCLSLVVKEDQEKMRTYFIEAMKGVPQTHEFRIIHKSGRLVYLMVTNIPITVDNEVHGVYGIAKDITLQKMAEENIERSEKLSLVGQLSASIAHEIRNPLTTLKGFLQLLNTRNDIDFEYINIMLSEMDRIESITSELLLLAKPQAVHFKDEEIKDLIEDVTTLLQSQALMKNIEMIFTHKEVGPISCVANQIKQVLINIIKNAIESMDNGGIITIKLFNAKFDSVVIEISDQGCGIPESLLPNIGLPFYSTKEKGTGLGMLTTYKLVNDHNGSITLNSKLGEGTTFKVYLPRNQVNSYHS